MAEYYLDVDYTDLTLTGTLTFTKDSTTVTGSGTAFTTELQTGDYIRSTDSTYGGTWYKVTGITDDTTLTINSKYLQETHSASAERNRGNGSQSSPFCHLAQYTTDTVRSPGDTLYCQLDQVLTTVFTINCDEDGNGNAPIYIIGSDWKNIGATGYFELDNKNLGNLTAGYISCISDLYWVFENLKFSNRTANLTYGAITYTTGFVKVKNCYFYNNKYCFDAYNEYGKCIAENCTFDTVGNAIVREGSVVLLNPSFVGNIPKIVEQGCVFIKNATIPSSTINAKGRTSPIVFVGSDTSNITSIIYELYDRSLPWPIGIDGMYDDVTNTIKTMFGTIAKNDTILFSTGNNAIEIVPNSSNKIGSEFPVAICEWELENVTTDNHTVEVKVMSKNLTTFPTADELYIEIDYLDESSPSYHLGTVKSSEVITANNTETTLSVNFTPSQDGKIRIRVMYGFNSSDTDAAIYVENGFTIN